MSNYLYNIINGVLEVFLICFFFQTFVKPIEWKGRLWSLVALGGIFTGLLFIPKPPPINFVIILLLIILISMLYRMKWYNHIFLSVFAIALLSMAEVVVAVVSSVILHLDMVVLKTGPYVFSGMLISKLVIFTVIAIIRCGRHTLPFKKVGILWAFIAFVLFTSVVNSFIVLDYMYMIVNHPIKQSLTVLAILLLILMNIMLFYVIDRINDFFETKHNLDTAKELIEIQKTSYKNLYESQNEVRKLRHDLKNSMLGILHLLDNGKTQEATQYIKTNLNILDESLIPSFPGNNIIDSLIDTKKKEAEKENIILKTEIAINGSSSVDPIDLSILLGNALDNAIESTRKQNKHPPIICCSIAYRQDNMLIVINNPVDHIIDVTRLESTKENKKQHGFGILQMKHLAAKYNGEVFFECSNEQFKTSILLGAKE